ncbi:MAG: hypothetical protein CBB96_05590 [Gammaproteobacteria bacterium TMED36]|nr:MAG: hypothetical protein CBB96_08890 [Gammaproteobacteria bacterium TMED36]OUT94636.1 MAG: hypothetical protein CBB96_05590 [Gammaproteobacteria bacterium TMED36]
MTHVFLLILIVGGQTVSKDMLFYDVERCNYFASQLVKRYGNYTGYGSVPKDNKATAYCEPRYVDTKKSRVYQ